MAKRTIRALYESEADATRVREELAAAGFDEVEILTRDSRDEPHGFFGRLQGMVGKEHAERWRGEVERGRVVLTAKVDEMLQTEAAEIIDASSLGQIVRDGDGRRGLDLESGAPL